MAVKWDRSQVFDFYENSAVSACQAHHESSTVCKVAVVSLLTLASLPVGIAATIEMAGKTVVNLAGASFSRQLSVKNGLQSLVETVRIGLLTGTTFIVPLCAWRLAKEVNNTDFTSIANHSLGTSPVLAVIGRKEAVLLGALSLVNHHFNRAVNHVVPLIVDEKKFGAKKWAEYIGDVGEEPPFPNRLKKLVATTNRVVAVLIPATVDGKPFTLTRLGELAKQPKKGESTGYSQYWNKIKAQHGSTPLERSYWVVLDREVLPGSLWKTRSKQLAMAVRAGGCAPKLIEAATAAIMHFLDTGERILGQDRWTFTICQEEPIEAWMLVVGGFCGSGLGVSHSHDFYDIDDVGVVVRRS